MFYFNPLSAESTRHHTQRAHTGPPFKIVTFYEDFADAVRAQRMLDRITQAFGGDAPVHATSWSFDLLCKPKLNSIIFSDAVSADVIVVAANGMRELSVRIATWVEICMHGRPGPKPVLVALHDEAMEEDGTAGPLCASLMQIADDQGTTFMCNKNLAPSLNHETPAEPFHARQKSQGLALATARHPATECPRWWGIND